MSNRNRAKFPTPAPMSLLVASFTLLFSLVLTIRGQSQNAIGAHRVFQKTSFSCSGRPAGYYADVETGCQVYHMCDGLGRQFSYSCPNTTLFQQRMLICDHWYMVNCSKAESHYTANLLIGQRDKPFVDDEENNLRTPRPDLLDRPYAPDYSGESFRNQYKQVAAVQNQIRDGAQKSSEKAASNQPPNGQTRWKIPPPIRTIQPPTYEAQSEDTPRPAVTPSKTPTIATTSKTTTTTTTQRPSIHRHQQNTNGFGNAALHPRKPVVFVTDHDDLGTSHSTRYNMSADFNSAEASPAKGRKVAGERKPAQATTTSAPIVNKDASFKVPSKIYEPPFVYPIYNQDDAPSIASTLSISTSAPFTSHSFTTAVRTPSTTVRSVSRPTTVAGRPFAPSASASVSTSVSDVRKHNAHPSHKAHNPHDAAAFHRFETQTQKALKDARTPTIAQGFKPPTPRPPVQTTKSVKPPATSNKFNALGGSANNNAELPFNDLLPPYVELVLHDVATTQGPPIYYEWKVPSNGLEPPKLDAPIGVDGREYPDAVIDYNTISSKGAFLPTSTVNSPAKSATGSENPFLKAAAAAAATSATTATKLPFNSQATKTPISRSIKETGLPNSSAVKTSIVKAQRRSDTVPPADISEIRKEWLVPEYAFPLESIGRTGYLAADTYNSFQLKIPERRSDTEAQKQHWFGENPKCPECHPSYVVPGTCAPCLRR